MLPWAIALLVTFAPPDSAATSQPPSVEEDSPQPETSPPGDVNVNVDVDVEAEAETETETGPVPQPGHEPGPEPAVEPGQLLLVPVIVGRYRIVGIEGQAEQTVTASADQPAVAQLPPGVYQIYDDAGGLVAVVVVAAGQTLVWDGDRSMSLEVWEQRPDVGGPAETTPPAPQRVAPHTHRHNWRAWASPLSSALVPGVGQFINAQPGKATVLLFGSIAATVGASSLYNLGNYGQRSNGAEYARLIGYGALSTAIPLLWVYAVADAYRVAVGETVESHVDHQVRVSLARTMTVGFRADVDRPGFYDDWSLSIMGQVVPRLTLGVSDLGVKFGGPTGPQVWQFGVRADYRVLERPRLWLNVGVGTAMQIASGRQTRPLDPDASTPYDPARFGAIPYAYFDARWFILDRLSLDFTPRLSVPVTTRYFSANRALPRFAPSLEFGAGISAYF